MPYLCYLNNYNIFLRERSIRKLYSKTHQIAQFSDKKSGEYIYAATPLQIVRSNTVSSCYFYIKNDYFLREKILTNFYQKYSLKRKKLHNFLKFSQGSMPPKPP